MTPLIVCLYKKTVAFNPLATVIFLFFYKRKKAAIQLLTKQITLKNTGGHLIYPGSISISNSII